MRKTFASLAVVLMLMPAVSFGATPQELESQRIDLLKQLVVLLEARVQQLVKLLEAKNGQVLGAATSTVSTTTSTSSASSTEVVKKKRRGGGGGGSRNSDSTPVIPEQPATSTATSTPDESTATSTAGLRFELSSGNPDATDIVVDEEEVTYDVTLLEYTIEAKGDDVTVNHLFVEVETGTVDVDRAIDGIGLFINGVVYEYHYDTTWIDQNYLMLGVDLEDSVTIASGTELTVEVFAQFNEQFNVETQANNYESGETVRASVTSELVQSTEAVDSEGAIIVDLEGSAHGDTHTLVTPGIVTPADGVESTVDALNDSSTIGAFTIEFEVTAVDGDYYINDLASSSSNATLGGVTFIIEDSSGSTTNAASISSTLVSTADNDTGAYLINEGETETFTLTVNFGALKSSQFRVVLEEVWFSENQDGGSAKAHYTIPASEFRTAWLLINDISVGGPFVDEHEPSEDDTATSTDVESEEVGLVVSNAVSTFSTPDAYAIANGFEGVIWLNFDVTAVGADAYIANWITKGNSVAGIEYEFEAQSGSGTPLAFIWSTVDTAGDVPHHIKEGTTETFTLEVFVNATEEGDFKITLSGVNYSQNPDGITNAVEVTPSPSSEFDSDWHHVSAS